MTSNVSSTVTDIVFEELATIIGDETVEINEDKLLKEDLGLPSIKLVMLLTNLTSKIGISILDFADYEIILLKSVGDLINLLTKKKDK